MEKDLPVGANPMYDPSWVPRAIIRAQTVAPLVTQAVIAEADPRRVLALFVADVSRVQDRVTPIYEVVKNAVRTEPDIAELGALRPGLSTDDAARTIWAVASPEVRQTLVTFAGWSVKRYRAWLEETLAAALLAPA